MTTLLFLFWLILPAISSEPTLCSPVDPTVPFMSGNLMMTDDAGTNWRNMSSELPATARPWSFTANEGQYYLGASDGIYAGSSMICGTEWEKIYFPQKDISGLYPGKKGPYASSPWSGFYQYQPATGLWRSMHEQLEDKNVYTVVETENGDIFAGCETGLYKTNNRGKSWKKVLDYDYIHNMTIVGDNIFACSQQGIWQSKDGGENWEKKINHNSTPISVQSVGESVVAIYDGQEIGMVRTPNAVFISSDEGTTWQPYFTEQPKLLESIYDLRKSGDFLIACSFRGIFRSVDEGKTWQPILWPPADRAGFFKIFSSEQTFYALLIEGC